MEFRVLGPLEVRHEGQALALGPPRVREVCGILLTRPGQLVSVSRFVDEFWGDRPPADARALVRGYLSRLRRALRAGPSGPSAADRLVTRKPGYLLLVSEGETDLSRFNALIADARSASQAGQPRTGLQRYRQALRLWRGEPFADVPATPAIMAAASRLTEQRLSVLEEQFDAALAAGEHAALVGELTEHLTAHPLRERPAAQLMLALHRSGRQADALATFERLRTRLAEDLGVDPGPQLRRLHQMILRGELDQAGDSVTVSGRVSDRSGLDRQAEKARVRTGQSPIPRQLPARPQYFVGRHEQLSRLTRTLDGQAQHGTMAISAVGGAGGVGKSWLALRWAHDNLDRFPDGQLYINLRGFDPSSRPLPPETALRSFLSALGVPPGGLPADLDAQTGLYRSLTAGKRMLVVLDNARDADQIRPLLPGSAHSVVVVTSRDQLSDLVTCDGAEPLTLGLVTSAEARLLLTQRLGRARVDAEQPAVQDIIAACAQLPLALAITAARAAAHPEFTLSALAAQLRDAEHTLDVFDNGGPTTGLRQVFSWSYTALGADAGRMFRLLGIHPGPDISLPAAASLAAVSQRRARLLLAELRRNHLATEHAPGRYTMHDLLRAYATELAYQHDRAQHRHAALHRIFDHYLHSGYDAALQLNPARRMFTLPPYRSGVTPERAADRRQALAWFTTEHAVLVAAVSHAATHGFDTHTWQLARTIGGFLDGQGHWHDWLTTQRHALSAAQRIGDRTAQAYAHCDLAETYAWVGSHDQVEVHLGQARLMFDETGDKRGAAYTHLCHGWLLEPHERFGEAIEHAERALRLYQAEGDQIGEAKSLNNIAWFHARLGHYEQAVTYGQCALDLLRAINNPSWEARAWATLGYAQHQLSRHGQAIGCYQRALTLFRELGNRYFEAKVLVRQGDTHQAAGHLITARVTWEQALQLLDELRHPTAHAVRHGMRMHGYVDA